MEALPFVAESFDVAIAALSFHHWSSKQTGLHEVFRVLRRGGRLIMGDPLLAGWLSKPLAGWLAQKTDGGVFAAPDTLTAFLLAAGFEQVSIHLVPQTMKSLYLISAMKPTGAPDYV